MTSTPSIVADATRIVDSAAQAFKTWSRTGPTQRRELLHKAADLLLQRSDAFVDCMVKETARAESPVAKP